MDLFVARQPIFDRSQNVYGYELLYRSQQTDAYDGLDGDRASLDVIHNTFLLIGSHNLTNGKKVFINFTKNLLHSKVAHNLPNELLVIEVLENTELDDNLLMACTDLQKAGYSLALDDFVMGKKIDRFRDLIDFIKVDFMLNTVQQRQEIADVYSRTGIKLLAEKTESFEDFHEARQMGYSYFQGYFFSKPIIVSRKDIPTTKLAYFNILQEVNREELDVAALEKVIKSDTALTYKLLKYINSAFFGLRQQVESISHSLRLLGQKEVRKWVSLVIMTIIAEDKPSELLKNSLIKAKFCEFLAREARLKEKESASFLVGMFANIDAFIGRPLDEIVDDMALPEESRAALKGKHNVYRDLLDTALTYEKGDWENLLPYMKMFNIAASRIPQLYVDAVLWAEQATKM